MKAIIQVEHFSKKYGDFTAVDDISFTVDEGSIFAFLGPNGAGKSTTINTLCTILDKTKGTLTINGHDVSRERSLVRKDIGIVFQDSTLDAQMTVEENLKYHCSFYKVPKNEVRERIDFALDLVELTQWRRAAVGSLSGGMKRRAEIARGLVHNPKVLFLDEPTTGLDPQTRANVWEYPAAPTAEKHDDFPDHPLYGRGGGLFPGRHHRPREDRRPRYAGEFEASVYRYGGGCCLHPDRTAGDRAAGTGGFLSEGREQAGVPYEGSARRVRNFIGAPGRDYGL